MHARSLALLPALLALRREHEALSGIGGDGGFGDAWRPTTRPSWCGGTGTEETFWIVVRFKGAGVVDLDAVAAAIGADCRGADLDLVLDTEHAEFARSAPVGDRRLGRHVVRFQRPGAVILKQR